MLQILIIVWNLYTCKFLQFTLRRQEICALNIFTGRLSMVILILRWKLHVCTYRKYKMFLKKFHLLLQQKIKNVLVFSLFVAMKTNLFPSNSLLLLAKPALITSNKGGDSQWLAKPKNSKMNHLLMCCHRVWWHFSLGCWHDSSLSISVSLFLCSSTNVLLSLNLLDRYYSLTLAIAKVFGTLLNSHFMEHLEFNKIFRSPVWLL